MCYPDYFWEQARDNLEGEWYLMCPHEILKKKGYALEDSFGEEWKKKYLDCVADPEIQKRVIPIKDVIRMIIKSVVETGTPFASVSYTHLWQQCSIYRYRRNECDG